MKKLEFTAEDFPSVDPDSKVNSAFDANVRLAEMLKDAKVVYSRADDGTSAWWPTKQEITDSVKGLLINIEELPKEPCKQHEPSGKLQQFGELDFREVCKHCGVPLEQVIVWKEATR